MTGLCPSDAHALGQKAGRRVPNVLGAIEEACHTLDDLGAAGITLQTNTRDMNLGDQALELLYVELARRDAIVFLHPAALA